MFHPGQYLVFHSVAVVASCEDCCQRLLEKAKCIMTCSFVLYTAILGGSRNSNRLMRLIAIIKMFLYIKQSEHNLNIFITSIRLVSSQFLPFLEVFYMLI